MPPGKFTLSAPALPENVTSEDGNEYPVDPDFRTILACLDRLADPDADDLSKALFVAARFYKGNPPPDMWPLFERFLLCGESPADGEDDPVMDFEQDADAIYASFRQQYGIDLIRDKLHWMEFRLLLRGLCEDTKFGELLKLRQLDPNDYAEKDRAKLRTLQDMVAIHPRVGLREAQLQAELDRRLRAGEDPSEILRQLQEEV